MTGKTRARSATAETPSADGDAIAMGLLPDLVGYHVRQAQLAIFADFDAALGELGVSPGIFALLVIAAAIEAFWSSAAWITPGVKYAVGGCCWVAVWTYLCFQGRRHDAGGPR